MQVRSARVERLLDGAGSAFDYAPSTGSSHRRDPAQAALGAVRIAVHVTREIGRIVDVIEKNSTATTAVSTVNGPDILGER